MTECNVKPLTSVYDWLTINFPLQCHCWTEHSMISSHDNQISAAHIGFSFQVQSLPSFLALVHVVFSNFCELRVVSFFNVCFRKNCNKTFTEFGFCIIKWIIKLHQPHPIIAYYCQLKELLIIKQFLLVSTKEMFREQCGEFVHW